MQSCAAESPSGQSANCANSPFGWCVAAIAGDADAIAASGTAASVTMTATRRRARAESLAGLVIISPLPIPLNQSDKHDAGGLIARRTPGAHVQEGLTQEIAPQSRATPGARQ